jgi:hypothetical protein
MLRKSTVHLTTICNIPIRLGYFPAQWKVTQIIMVSKPSKPLEEVNFIHTNQLTANNEQNLPKSYAQEIMPDVRGKLNPP